MMDHMDPSDTSSGEQEPDMQYLSKPRGKGYTLRMVTPDILVGTMNPWTKKPFGKEIKLGLATRSYAEAIRIRDVRVGDVRKLEAEAAAAAGHRSIGGIIDLSPENAAEWRRMRDEAEDTEAIDYVLEDKLEKAARAGLEAEASSFGHVVFRGAIPLGEALEQYLEERREGNPFGFDPLALTTTRDVRSSMKHFVKFLGVENPTLHHATPDTVFEFRTRYLPIACGLKLQTVKKHVTLMNGMWKWAIHDKRYLKSRRGKPIRNPWIIEASGTSTKKSESAQPDEKRTAYTPEQVARLLKGFPSWGSRQGDLMRLLLVTGCRADEVGSLLLKHVGDDGSYFRIAGGKTANAVRYIPVVEDAQRLLMNRIVSVGPSQQDIPKDQQRLFPDWPLKPTTGKANSISQWFTRYRRETLGKGTDGTLALHSFRHTWRTVARLAGAAEDRVLDLGGWGKKNKNSSDPYDHGVPEEELAEAQRAIWGALKQGGYLEEF
ncbi:MAG: site-specific integrase [Marinosulfonomonas sp.]